LPTVISGSMERPRRLHGAAESSYSHRIWPLNLRGSGPEVAPRYAVSPVCAPGTQLRQPVLTRQRVTTPSARSATSRQHLRARKYALWMQCSAMNATESRPFAGIPLALRRKLCPLCPYGLRDIRDNLAGCKNDGADHRPARPHNPEVGGSNPPPAKLRQPVRRGNSEGL
jgi:hypothetical protein